MKASKVREMTAEELQKREQDLKEELFRLRFQHVTGQLENPVRMRILRRDLAQAVTIRHEKETTAGKKAADEKEKAG